MSAVVYQCLRITLTQSLYVTMECERLRSEISTAPRFTLPVKTMDDLALKIPVENVKSGFMESKEIIGSNNWVN